MRRYYKNEIVKAAKPVEEAKMYDIYFLVDGEEIVYVDTDFQKFGMESHDDKVFDKFFSYNVSSQRKARQLLAEYVKDFSPKYNPPLEVYKDDMAMIDGWEKEAKRSSKKDFVKAEKPKPETTVSMPPKQAIEVPLETIKTTPSKTYKTRQLVRYLQNISLQPGCYKIDKRNGIPTLFVNINNKLYHALADAEMYTYEETTYRMPDEMKGYLKDIVVN